MSDHDSESTEPLSDSTPDAQSSQAEQDTGSRPSWLRAGAVVAVLGVVMFVGWLLVSRSQSPAPQSTPAPATSVTPVKATIVSAEQLRAVPAKVGHPVYWAGEIPAKSTELTVTADGAVYVRYLPKGASPGTESAFLSVATYPRGDAYELVQRGAERPGAVTANDKGGALVTARGENAPNAYFAFDGVPLLVEVFDPEPGRAFEEIQSGRVQLIQ